MSSPVSVELERAAAFLAARGVESARLEAEVLLADALGSDRGRLYLERVVSDPVRLRRSRALIRRETQAIHYSRLPLSANPVLSRAM